MTLIDQHSIRRNERRDVGKYLIIYRKVLQIHLHYTKQRKWLHNIIHEKLANLCLLRIYRKTKWRSWPLSMHLCEVIHLYHSWCDLQIPLGLVNWKIQMPWDPKSRTVMKKQTVIRIMLAAILKRKKKKN